MSRIWSCSSRRLVILVFNGYLSVIKLVSINNLYSSQEIAKSGNENADDASKYRQELVKTLHTATIKVSPSLSFI